MSPAAAELGSSATASLTEQSISVKPQSAASAEGADTSGFHDVTPRVSEATVEDEQGYLNNHNPKVQSACCQ